MLQLVGKLFGYLALLAGALFVSLPTLYMVSTSLMTSQDLFAIEFHFFPTAIYVQNYVEVFANFNFSNYLQNSAIITSAVVILNLIFSPMLGYSLAKFDFPGKAVLMLFILATVMVPFTAILIPLFLIIRTIDWVNSYPGLIMPFAMSAFGIFLMRQFLLAVPDDYIDAGRIDGAGELRIYFQIAAADSTGARHPGHCDLCRYLGRISLDAGHHHRRRPAHPAWCRRRHRYRCSPPSVLYVGFILRGS